MPFFGNRRRDFSIQPPRQQVDGTPFFVTDSANIDFTLDNLNLTADLTFTGVTAGTYGDATNIPVLQIDQWGRVTGVTLQPISPSGLALEVNGTANASQTILNLTNGTDIDIQDLGGGNIQISYTGTGGTYTVNNGLSAQTVPSANPNNFQLGGSLIQNTTITNNGFDFIVSRTSAGNAIEGINTVGSGILGDSISNTGVIGISDTNTGVSGLSNTGIPIIGTVFPATNNDVKTVLRLINSNLSPANGTGSAIEFRAGTSASPQVFSGKLSFLWTDVNSSTRTSKFQVETINSGIPLNKLEVNGPGQLKLNRYGQTPANFPGTAVWALGADVNGNVVEFTPSTGTGTVTSVALSMPSAFNVTGSPITTSGTLTVSGAGLTSQYIRGDGTLANFPTNVGGGSSVSYYLNGSVNQGTFGGNVYYQMSRTANTGPAANFTINADGYIAQFITDSNDPSLLNIPGGNWDFQIYFSASSSGGSPQFYVELYKYDGTSFTLISSGSTSPENITTGTFADVYISTLTVPQTTLAITDRLAIRIYVIHSGRIITMYTQDSKLAEVHTTFSTGIAALNGLTDQVQSFANGITGTAPNWNSVSPTHTLNIPLASTAGVTAGLISNADYGVFNGKLSNTLNSANIFVGNASNVATAVAMSGDATLANTGALTIANNAVTYAKMQAVSATSRLLGSSDTTTPIQEITLGTGLSLSGTTLSVTGGGGNSIGQLTSPGDVTTPAATAPSQGVTATLNTSYKTGSCGVVFDGQGGVISNGRTAYVQVPYKGTITGWTLVAAQLGSCTVTVFKDILANFPPVSPSDNIFGTQPALSSSQTNSATGLSVAVAAGDWIGFTISGVTTVTWVNLTLSITKII